MIEVHLKSTALKVGVEELVEEPDTVPRRYLRWGVQGPRN